MSVGAELLEEDAQLGAAVDEAMGAGAGDSLAEPVTVHEPWETSERPAGWQIAQRLQTLGTSPVREMLDESGVVTPWAGSMGGAVAANARRGRRNF